MRTTTMCLTATLLLAPAALLAQDSTAASQPTAQTRIDAALAAAVKAGIPTSLLERKVAEGEAKGVAEDRIAAAVEQRLEALIQADNALTKADISAVTEGQLSVAADAVQAGVNANALVAVSKDASDGSRAVAIAALTDLVAMGQSSAQALAQVQAALSRGPEALANLSAAAAGSGAAGSGAAGNGAAGTAGAAVGAGVTGSTGGAGVQVGAGAGAQVNLGSPKGN
jgi:hypothetical protein